MQQDVYTRMDRAAVSKRKRRVRKLAYSAMGLILLGLLWTGYVLWKIESAASAPANQADVGIILGASMWGEEPSPGLRERLEHALLEYRQGRFVHFIVSGGLDAPGMKYTEAEGMRNYLVQAGVPEERVFLENEATSTYENLLFSQQIMEEQGWVTALIITHDYHGSRAMEIARTLGYEEPTMSLTESTVLPMIKHKSREVLAYTKWTVDRALLALGWL